MGLEFIWGGRTWPINVDILGVSYVLHYDEVFS